MNKNDYTVSIDGINDCKGFFSEILSFYAKQDVILTIFSKLPNDIYKNLDQYKAPCSWIHRWVFKQSDYYLNANTLSQLSKTLCDDELLGNLTWGLIKSDIPLGLCRSWDDMSLDGSELIEDQNLFTWLDQLKERGLIQSFERISD